MTINLKFYSGPLNNCSKWGSGGGGGECEQGRLMGGATMDHSRVSERKQVRGTLIYGGGPGSNHNTEGICTKGQPNMGSQDKHEKEAVYVEGRPDRLPQTCWGTTGQGSPRWVCCRTTQNTC